MNENSAYVSGNMTRDPVLRYTPSQTAVCDFGLASTRKFRTGNEDREETLFIDCVVFGKPAEWVNEAGAKGRRISVRGRLQYQSWESKDGSGKRSKIQLVVENFDWLESRQAPQGERQSEPQQPREDARDSTGRPTNMRQPKKEQHTIEEALGPDTFTEQDCPF